MPTNISSSVTAEYTAAIPVPDDGEYASHAALANAIRPVANRAEYLRDLVEVAPWRIVSIFEDFLAARVSSLPDHAQWDQLWNSSNDDVGSWNIADLDFEDALGVVRFLNTSGSASASRYRKSFSMARFENVRRITARVRASSVASGMNLEIGWLRSTDPNPGNEDSPSHAASVVFMPSSSANWRLRTDDGSSSTYVDTGVPVAADTWYQLDLVHDGALGVTLSIDGATPVGALTTIPALDDEGSLQWKIAAPAAGANRAWILDFIAGRFDVPGRVI